MSNVKKKVMAKEFILSSNDKPCIFSYSYWKKEVMNILNREQHEYSYLIAISIFILL